MKRRAAQHRQHPAELRPNQAGIVRGSVKGLPFQAREAISPIAASNRGVRGVGARGGGRRKRDER